MIWGKGCKVLQITWHYNIVGAFIPNPRWRHIASDKRPIKQNKETAGAECIVNEEEES